MKIHVATVHEGKKPFKCEVCDYKWYQKSSLENNVASVHTGNKPFTCVCDYSSSQKSKTNEHVYQFMQERNLSNVKFVTTVAHERLI